MVVFVIKDYKNKQVFKNQFSSLDLLGDMADVLSPKQKEDTIKARMVHFFDERNFSSPAIDSSQTIDEAFENYDKVDKANWYNVKSDHTSVGFFYSYGYESTYGIAFLKKKKKTIAIFYSD